MFQTRCLEIPSVKEALLHLSRREKDVVIVAYWPGAKLFYREFGGGGRPFGGLISKPPPQVNVKGARCCTRITEKENSFLFENAKSLT